MESWLIDMEVSEGGEVEGGGVVDPEPVEPVWAGPSQDEWQQLSQAVQSFGNYAPTLEQLHGYLQSAPDPQQPQMPEYDPFEPETVQAYINAAVQRGVEDSVGPFQGVLGLVAEREAEQMARQELTHLSSQVGEFDHDTALMLAQGISAQYPPGSRVDSSAILRAAAERTRAWEQGIREKARADYKAELDAITGAPRDQGGGHAAGDGQMPVPTGKDRYEVAINAALARRRPTLPV